MGHCNRMHIAVPNPVFTTVHVRFMLYTLAMAGGEKLAMLTQWLLIWGGAAWPFREHAHFLVPSEGRRGSCTIVKGGSIRATPVFAFCRYSHRLLFLCLIL